MSMRAAWPGAEPPARRCAGYGVVVLSVKVSALLYVPVRSGSLALTSCENSSVTASLEIGALHVSRFSGEADEPTLLYAVPWLAALRARACSGWASTNRPPDVLTRWPTEAAMVSGSATLSSASPAVERTVALVEAR